MNERADFSTEGTFKSICVDVWFDDEPGDHTVGPIPPGPLLEHAKVERAKYYGPMELKAKSPNENGPAE